jgi:hypothetical protein
MRALSPREELESLDRRAFLERLNASSSEIEGKPIANRDSGIRIALRLLGVRVAHVLTDTDERLGLELIESAHVQVRQDSELLPCQSIGVKAQGRGNPTLASYTLGCRQRGALSAPDNCFVALRPQILADERVQGRALQKHDNFENHLDLAHA